MTALSGVATFVLGVALGTALFLTARGALFQNRAVYSAISLVVNIFRSIPFIILIVLLIPFTKAMVGTILGANAALPALIVGPRRFMRVWSKLPCVKSIKALLKRHVRWARV